MIEAISGLVVAIVIIILSRVLVKYFTVKLFAAANLIAIALIYVGFSLKDNPAGWIALECCVALIFFFMALIGYTKNNVLIALGIILHGAWDILHHNGFFIDTSIPVYWPTFCLVIDIVDGVYFWIIFNRQKKMAF